MKRHSGLLGFTFRDYSFVFFNHDVAGSRPAQDSELYNGGYNKHRQDKGISLLAEPTPR